MLEGASLWSPRDPDRPTILDRLMGLLPLTRRKHEAAVAAIRAAYEQRLEQQLEYFQGEEAELRSEIIDLKRTLADARRRMNRK